MGKRKRYLAPLALLGLGLLVVGCSQPGGGGIKYAETGATLEGTVSYGDEKLNVALVIVQNDSGTATALVDENGHYKVENVPLGEVHIGVNTDAGKGQAMGKMMAQAQGKPKSPPKFIDVPKKYQDPATSGLKTTVNKGPNEYNIVVPRGTR